MTDPVGRELEPTKVIVSIPEDRFSMIQGARELSVGLGPELLASRALVLVAFPLPNAAGKPPTRGACPVFLSVPAGAPLSRQGPCLDGMSSHG